MTVRVLVVDDSPTMRAILMSRLSHEADIEVIATAGDAREARALIKELSPDVITLDIEMPGMNGLEFLEKIMRLRPTPVVVISGMTSGGDEIAARALALGAVECYSKSDRSGAIGLDDGGALANSIRRASRVRLVRPAPGCPPTAVLAPVVAATDAQTDIIAIGSSTGGIEALQTILADLTADGPPTVVVQHVNARFAPAIAASLDEITPANVVLADDAMPLRRGHVYFAPGGDRHMSVGPGIIRLRSGATVSGHLPSVDVLFRSVAEHFGARAVGALLTGMGRDGAEGLLAMAQTGARTIAQDEATSTVFGMPRAAIELGAARVVAPLGRIAGIALGRAA